MKPLARKTVALAVTAALLHGASPPCAFAGAARPVAAGKTSGVDSAAALEQMRRWGVFKEGDVLQGYLAGKKGLTPLGRALYLSLSNRYNPAEEVEGMKPVFDRLRENGPYDERRAGNVARTYKLFEEKFGKIDQASTGSLEEQFLRGAQREALMTGAAVNEPPKAEDLTQVRTKDGYEFWDEKGLAYRINKNNATTYNRELQKAQRQYNLSRPPQVAFVPETGRYNFEMFNFSYWRLKNQYADLVEGMRRDRVIAVAELLGEANKYREDMWFTDKRLEADLIAKAGKKTYNHRGKEYSVLDLVDAKFKQRQAYLDGSLKGIERYQKDLFALKETLRAEPLISDAQVQTMVMGEQYALRYLSLSVLETQMFYVKNQGERLDPASSDSEQVMKALDESKLTPAQRASYKARAREMVERLKALRQVLERTRDTLSAADYAGSLDLANAALSSSQRELVELSADYAMFVEVPSVAHLGRQQADVGMLNFGSKLTRGLYRWARPGSEYARAMKALEDKRPELDAVAALIASSGPGDMGQARKAMIAMNPDALKMSLEASLGGEQGRITDSVRLAASLKVNRDRIGTVFETNKWLDTAGNYINWTVSLALAAPTTRWALNGAAGKLSRFANVEAPAGANFLVRTGAWTVRRGSIAVSETFRHTAARLGSLDPSREWVQAQASSAVGRFLLASSVRGANVAVRQGAFTVLSGGISGAFVTGSHLWDAAHLTIAGHEILKPGHSMFNEDFEGAVEAFAMGAKGGIWWANESWHPALGYVGLPSTAFRGMHISQAMEVVGTRGVLGTSLTGAKGLLRRFGAMAPAVEGAAAPGFLERVAALKWVGKPAAFAFGMTDNVAKYVVFSEAAGGVGRQYGYHVSRYAGAEDTPEGAERRIKGANAISQKWLESPAWLLIPTYAAHQARDAAGYMRSKEGAAQFESAGLIHEVANAEQGTRLRFVEKPKTPWSQRIFETSIKSDATGDYWIVTEEIRLDAMRKGMTGTPMDFYRVAKMADGDKYINLRVNDDVRNMAHKKFTESLLADPALTERVLEAHNGALVEGFGRVTPKVKMFVSEALHNAELQVGRAMPKQFQARVGAALKPYLDATMKDKPFAEGFIQTVNKTPKTETFKTALEAVREQVQAWKQGGGSDYMEVVTKLRDNAKALKAEGKITAPEHEVLAKMYDYVEALERHFNHFNNVETVQALAAEGLGALKTEYAGREGPSQVLDGLTSALDSWARKHAKTDAVAGPRADGSFRAMLEGRLQELKASESAMTPAEFKAMKAAIDDMAASPWILHDSKGNALSSWRPEQFEGLMSTLTAWAEQGRGGDPVRVFQLLKTGGGKTAVSFFALLPLIEADAKVHKMKPIFLTVQSNLEAQARMEYIAYKLVGTRIDFDTYEGFKTKIAEGKTKGQNAMRDYWIMGDEMDGAALQPALTIGEVSGRVTKLNPVFKRAEEIDLSLGARLDRARSAAANKALTEARRAGYAMADLAGVGGEAVKIEGIRMEAAAEKLSKARGPDSRRQAESDLRRSSRRLENLLDALPSSERSTAEAVRRSLGEIKSALDAPATDAAFRKMLAAEMKDGFAREKNLMQLITSERGLDRLAVESHRKATALEARAERLQGDELSLVQRELSSARRFESVDSGKRLANLQEKIAGAEGGGGAPASKLAAWKSDAARLEAGLPAERKGASAGHAEALRKIHETGREVLRVNDQIIEAKRDGKPTGELEARRAALEADYATLRGAAGRHKAELSAGGSPRLSAEVARARLSEAADEILGEVREAKPGWEDRASRLLKQRRDMMTAFAGDENPFYAVFGDMKENMRSFAMNKALQSEDPKVREHAREVLLRQVDGQSLLRFAPKLPKLLLQVFGGKDVNIPVDHMGLTRLHAAKLLKALSADPTIPAHQRDDLFWNIAPSLLWPNGISGKRSSWVRTELLRQFHGFFEDPAGIRLDGRTKHINVVHNGQWFESMDNESRRFWELEYGVDLTLPYTHQSISTIKDVTTDQRARFISFSGTAGQKLREHFDVHKIKTVGAGSKAPEVVELDAVTSSGNIFKRIHQALANSSAGRGEVVVRSLDNAPEAARKAVSEKIGGPLREPAVLKLSDFEGPAREWLASLRRVQGDADHVVVRPNLDAIPVDVKPAIDAYLTANKAAGKENAVVRISEVKSDAAQAWLRELRGKQKETGLVVLSVSDTHMLKTVRQYLLRTQGIKAEEISMVFSDAEYLRNNVPDAEVAKQMNLGALDKGTARFLILDTRVGGRGLDLNFKGEGKSLDPKAFRGYTNFEMLLIEPHKMSQVHLLQSEGRIDLGRIHPAAGRDFSLVLDVKAVQGERVFLEMVRSDPFFEQLRGDPAFQKYAADHKIAKPDWLAYHEFVRENPRYAAEYQKAVKGSLEKVQSEVELNQLRSSSVETDAPVTPGRFPSVERMR